MSAGVRITVDVGEGYERVRATFARMPDASRRAMLRALRKLSTWSRRRVLQAASQATGIPQRWFVRSMRFQATVRREHGTPVAVQLWIGTRPIKVHRLGAVRWTRRMQGARVGRRSYPGSWSWGRGKTGPAVMERSGEARLPINVIKDDIHWPVLARLQSIEPELQARFETLLRQELNYALNVEARG